MKMHVFLLYGTHFSLPEAVPDPEICQKHVCGRGSTPAPAGELTPPDPL